MNYGKNLTWFLEEVENADKDQIEDSEIDVCVENEAGIEGFCSTDVRELCGAARKRIEELELALSKHAEVIEELHRLRCFEDSDDSSDEVLSKLLHGLNVLLGT